MRGADRRHGSRSWPARDGSVAKQPFERARKGLIISAALDRPGDAVAFDSDCANGIAAHAKPDRQPLEARAHSTQLRQRTIAARAPARTSRTSITALTLDATARPRLVTIHASGSAVVRRASSA